MIYKLQDQLLKLFLEDKTSEVEDISALNVAALQLRHLPYFENAYPYHFLAEKGEGFFKLYYDFKDEYIDADPLRDTYHSDFHYYYDEDSAGPPIGYFPINQPEWFEYKTTPFFGDIPPSIQTRADAYLKRLHHISPLMRMASEPSTEDLLARKHIELRVLNYEELRTFTKTLLGDQHPSSLKPEGIEYHNPAEHSWSSGNRRYIVVHTEHEVAGVCGIIKGSHTVSLCYVSVATGFRRQGVSGQLYQALIDYAQEKRCLLVRSSPSGVARDNPSITRSYDRMLSGNTVLHAGSDTALSSTLTELLEQHSYEHVVGVGKEACEKLSVERAKEPYHTYSGPWQEIDRTLAKEVREALRATPKPRRPSP